MGRGGRDRGTYPSALPTRGAYPPAPLSITARATLHQHLPYPSCEMQKTIYPPKSPHQRVDRIQQ